MSRFSIDELLRDLAAAMAGLGRRWYLFGAQAVAVHGRPRLTADVDVTIEAEPADVPAVLQALERRGFERRVAEAAAFVERTRVLPLVHVASGMPLDLVFAGPGLEQEFLAHARTTSVGGVAVPVIAPEDLIVAKVLAGRPRDLEDVRGILAERGATLDHARIDRFLGLLEEALDRSDLRQSLQALAGVAAPAPKPASPPRHRRRKPRAR
jgi:ribosomal protein L12E/L44/L45/RPP1/RPP2